MTVVVATLIPLRNAATTARIRPYDARSPGIVDDVRAAGDLRDELPPNDAGCATMGTTFLAGVLRAVRAHPAR